jgi:branched-chain amino acid transport system substrate-binding protein
MKTGKFFVLYNVAILGLFPNMQALAGPAQKKVLNVGIILRLNDQFNESVSAMMTGIETAKALFEKDHPSVKIVFHKYAHNEDLESVVAASNLAIKDKVPAVIGGELSEESFVLRDKLGANKIVFITPTSSNPAVTENQPYAFRACFSDRLVASQLANLTIDHLKPKVVGLLHNVSSPYTDFLSQQFLETFKERMSKQSQSIPIFEEKVLRDTTDFSEQIRHFMDNKVTHVIMPVHQTDFLRFQLQAAGLGFFPVYVGSDGWGSNDNVLRKFVTESKTGVNFVAFRNSYWKEDANFEMANRFKGQYAMMNKKQPTAWSAISFDAAWVLFTAMSQVKDVNNGTAIRDQLHAIKSVKAVTSEHFSFGPDNSPRKDLYIYRIDKDGIRYEVTLK